MLSSLLLLLPFQVSAPIIDNLEIASYQGGFIEVVGQGFGAPAPTSSAGQELFLEQPPVCRGSATQLRSSLITIVLYRALQTLRVQSHDVPRLEPNMAKLKHKYNTYDPNLDCP